jgi:hypothetical protein
VLGAHAMGSDSVVRNLTLLNSLWDGGSVRIDRRTTESYTVQGVASPYRSKFSRMSCWTLVSCPRTGAWIWFSGSISDCRSEIDTRHAVVPRTCFGLVRLDAVQQAPADSLGEADKKQ